jgi:hypothetical protein
MIYKVESANATVGARDIRISKVAPSLVDVSCATQGGDKELLKDSFVQLATIEHHMMLNSPSRCNLEYGPIAQRGAR